MNIGLIDVDGHNYPNLALMKISAWHKALGDTVEFATMFGDYDFVYKSKVFTFTPDDEYHYGGALVVKGGTGYDVTSKLPDEVEHMLPDYSLYRCDSAYGFLTRGCPRKCKWCLVPRKEGAVRSHADIDEFIGDFDSVVLMDNNVLAHEHGIAQIEKISRMKIKVDFNQGLDARLIDDSMARLLANLRWLKPLRMACDHASQMDDVQRATELLRKHGATPKAYFVYVLVTDDIPDAHQRVTFLRDLGLDPFAQAYRDFTTNTAPSQEQRDFCRWVNHKATFKSTDFFSYGKPQRDTRTLLLGL